MRTSFRLQALQSRLKRWGSSLAERKDAAADIAVGVVEISAQNGQFDAVSLYQM